MVCGVAPFVADSPVSVAYKHVREEPIPPSQRNPDVPPALEQIIMSALAKDPDHRYQSADDLRADLLRFRRGRPLAAAPVTAIVAEVPDRRGRRRGHRARTPPRPRSRARASRSSRPRPTTASRAGAGTRPRSRAHAARARARRRRHPLRGDEARQRPGDGLGAQRRRQDAGDRRSQALAAQHLIRGRPSRSRARSRSGTVIAQNPSAGDDVKKNSQVTLSVSAGVGTEADPRRHRTRPSPTRRTHAHRRGLPGEGRPRAVEQHASRPAR